MTRIEYYLKVWLVALCTLRRNGSF